MTMHADHQETVRLRNLISQMPVPVMQVCAKRISLVSRGYFEGSKHRLDLSPVKNENSKSIYLQSLVACLHRYGLLFCRQQIFLGC